MISYGAILTAHPARRAAMLAANEATLEKEAAAIREDIAKLLRRLPGSPERRAAERRAAERRAAERIAAADRAFDRLLRRMLRELGGSGRD